MDEGYRRILAAISRAFRTSESATRRVSQARVAKRANADFREFASESGLLQRGVVAPLAIVASIMLISGLIVARIFAQGVWATHRSMPTARWQSIAGLVNGTIIVAGGYNYALGGHLKNVEAYDPVTDTWTIKNPLPGIQTASASGVINGTLYAAGGTNCCVEINTLNAYDPSTDSWSLLASIPTARDQAGARWQAPNFT